jgi:hypothetical protein
VIEPRRVALHAGHNLPQARCTTELAAQQRNQLRLQFARQLESRMACWWLPSFVAESELDVENGHDRGQADEST